MKTYIFRVELEPDAEGWRAFYPPLEESGASTWGETKESALEHIQEVLEMIIEERIEAKLSIQEEDDSSMADGPLVSVTV
ncbi:MAG: hypothetical protein O3A93_01880 [Chloroflexi bacterium]|nr:hypothetical protein [Chloroflexota bacterium]MDA1269996.1 hypothetical protein [Chloroflexota bacterium]PKB59181.1 MAG: hypothetical protein BZY83_03195 [SAR202 cluster bacterium Casp-Chloro-G2]